MNIEGLVEANLFQNHLFTQPIFIVLYYIDWFWKYIVQTLYAEQILNKIANTFDGTYTGLKSMLQRFGIYSAQNPRFKFM